MGAAATSGVVPDRSKSVGLLLNIFFGFVGADRYYQGQTKQGIALSVMTGVSVVLMIVVAALEIEVEMEVAAISDLRKRVAQLEAFGAAYSAPPPPPPPERARAAADPAWAKAAARGEVEMDVPSYEHSMEARQKWRESAAGKAAREKAAPPAAEADGRAEATALLQKAKAEADAFEAGDNADGVDAPKTPAAAGTARLCVV